MAAVFVDEVKNLPAQLLNFQLDRRDVTHDMRLVLVRYRLKAYGALSAKQCSISILLVSSSGGQAGNRKRRLQPLACVARRRRQRLEPSLTLRRQRLEPSLTVLLKFSPSNGLASLAI